MPLSAGEERTGHAIINVVSGMNAPTLHVAARCNDAVRRASSNPWIYAACEA